MQRYALHLGGSMAAGGVHGSSSVRSAHGKPRDREVAQSNFVSSSARFPLFAVFTAAAIERAFGTSLKEVRGCT